MKMKSEMGFNWTQMKLLLSLLILGHGYLAILDKDEVRLSCLGTLVPFVLYVYILPKSASLPMILTFQLLFYQITTDRDGTGGGEDVRQFADPRQAQRPQHAHQPNNAT